MAAGNTAHQEPTSLSGCVFIVVAIIIIIIVFIVVAILIILVIAMKGVIIKLIVTIGVNITVK